MPCASSQSAPTTSGACGTTSSTYLQAATTLIRSRMDRIGRRL
jgi:hypothetical protein